MMTHAIEGYTYPADEIYMLAYYVNCIFSDSEKAIQMAQKAREHAKITHCPETNMNQLLKIYQEMVGKE